MTDLFTDSSKVTIGKHRMQFWIDSMDTDEYSFKIAGWAYIAGISSWKLDVKVDFQGSKYSFSCKAVTIRRHDVSLDHRHRRANYEDSGLFIEVPRQNIGPDKYNVSLTFKMKKTNELILTYPFVCIEVK